MAFRSQNQSHDAFLRRVKQVEERHAPPPRRTGSRRRALLGSAGVGFLWAQIAFAILTRGAEIDARLIEAGFSPEGSRVMPELTVAFVAASLVLILATGIRLLLGRRRGPPLALVAGGLAACAILFAPPDLADPLGSAVATGAEWSLRVMAGLRDAALSLDLSANSFFSLPGS